MSSIHKINFFFACIILAVDSLNGFFLFKGINLPISQVFKLLFTATMIMGLIKLYYHKFVIWFVLLVLFVSIFNIGNNPIFFFESLILSQKFLFTVLTYFYFTEYFKKSSALNYNFVYASNLSVIILNIIFSLVGIGYFAYSQGIGYTGFFFAPNELSFLVLIFFSHYLYEINLRKSKYFIPLFILLLIISTMLAMKVAIMGVFLVGWFVFFSGKLTLKKMIFASVVLLFVIFLLSKYFYLLEAFINMLKYRYNSSDNMINFFLSNRDKFLIEEIGLYLNSSAIALLFGLSGTMTVEMDFFDVLFNYGLIGFIIIYLFYIYVVITSRKNKTKRDGRFSLFVNLLVILTSLFVGHFVFSAMGGFFFAYFNAVKRKDKKHLEDK